jgi:hypothetical protein
MKRTLKESFVKYPEKGWDAPYKDTRISPSTRKEELEVHETIINNNNWLMQYFKDNLNRVVSYEEALEANAAIEEEEEFKGTNHWGFVIDTADGPVAVWYVPGGFWVEDISQGLGDPKLLLDEVHPEEVMELLYSNKE